MAATVFSDEFDRSDGSTIGNGWADGSGVSLANGRLVLSDLEFIAPYTSRDISALALALTGDFTMLLTVTSAPAIGYAYVQLADDALDNNIALLLDWTGATLTGSLAIRQYAPDADEAIYGTALTPGTVYNIEWQVNRSTGVQRARIWQHGTTKPSAWAVTADVSTTLALTTLTIGNARTV